MHFEQETVDLKASEIWFDINNIPLKWNVPIGVIIDNLIKDQDDLPICANVHFKNFPDSSLTRFKGVETTRFYYFNSLKESATIKIGSTREILELSNKETSKLLDIVLNPSKMLKEYMEIQKKIYENAEVKRLPIKFVFNKLDIILTKPYDLDAHGVDCTLGEFIQKSFEKKVADLILTSKVIIVSQKLDFNTPICFIALNLFYSDGFTYISVMD